MAPGHGLVSVGGRLVTTYGEEVVSEMAGSVFPSEGGGRAGERVRLVVMVRERHLSPFRTEPLSPATPMVLESHPGE